MSDKPNTAVGVIGVDIGKISFRIALQGRRRPDRVELGVPASLAGAPSFGSDDSSSIG